MDRSVLISFHSFIHSFIYFSFLFLELVHALLHCVIIQAKQFLKCDWLKRVVFQRNLKYLHVGISFPWQPTRSCFDFENTAERFPELGVREGGRERHKCRSY